ncbi:MAG: phosphate ABC transporter permease subunit PstC [Chloroflexi bacterium]|nr:phosphate ABC transporter permease subunit PstC [Chloroflexota bacterium]
MRITATDHAADTLTVERGINDTRLSEHDTSSQISQPDAVTFGEFITHTVWQPQTGEYGIWALLTATLLTSGVALIVAIPLGVGAAIYLSEYAKPQTRSTLKPILEVLAGIPTVVYGFFALTFVTPSLKNLLFGSSLNSLNMLAAGITIGVLITPMISSMCEDAISAVPRSLREASTGLGATKLETTVKVIIPAAISGISAAIIVAMSRAVGETMIVLLASGAGPNFTLDLRQSAETMAGHIARISTGDIEYGSLDYTSIFAVGTTLFIVTLGLNVISNQISRRLRERY